MDGRSGMSFYLHGRTIDRGNSYSGSRVVAAWAADLGMWRVLVLAVDGG